MAKYIDTAILKKHGFVLAKVKYDKNGEVKEFMTVQPDDAPTADVVPKSEVDLYRKQVDELEDELASTYDKLEEAETEVAREIFEEIEKQIDLTLSAIQKILNAKGGKLNGKTVLISKYDMLIESKKFITELKKKYTGDME